MTFGSITMRLFFCMAHHLLEGYSLYEKHHEWAMLKETAKPQTEILTVRHGVRRFENQGWQKNVL
jgi:hypothetical protein